MKSKLYSYLLVTVQFACILVLVMRTDTIWAQPFPLLVFLVGASVGVYAISHNQGDNFNIIPEIKENAELITTGAYAYVRHPMYFSVLLMMLGFLCATPTILHSAVYALLIVVLFLKTRKEESLWIQKSDAYRAYKIKTKSIIPFLL
ncbi:MAG: hypothetical protein KU29_00845 [Sulfurovum sp. FS06-10]|nr:MAG: hypothetical protein KU29_00845 [Sulfurovum sp. FS06-10]